MQKKPGDVGEHRRGHAAEEGLGRALLHYENPSCLGEAVDRSNGVGPFALVEQLARQKVSSHGPLVMGAIQRRITSL
jgi:hypothetical protein